MKHLVICNYTTGNVVIFKTLDINKTNNVDFNYDSWIETWFPNLEINWIICDEIEHIDYEEFIVNQEPKYK